MIPGTLYKPDFLGDKVYELWSTINAFITVPQYAFLIIQNQSDCWMNGSVCEVDAMEQVPIMLLLR